MSPTGMKTFLPTTDPASDQRKRDRALPGGMGPDKVNKVVERVRGQDTNRLLAACLRIGMTRRLRSRAKSHPASASSLDRRFGTDYFDLLGQLRHWKMPGEKPFGSTAAHR
jgi:hypothetical protein